MSRTPEQRKSDAQEKRTAKTYGGQVTPMSGAGWKHKADVRTDQFLIENKTKMRDDAKSYSIKAEDLRKIRMAAIESGRVPILQVDLARHRYVVLHEDDFLDLMGIDEDE